MMLERKLAGSLLSPEWFSIIQVDSFGMSRAIRG